MTDRVAKVRAAQRDMQIQRELPLDEGDTIEYGLTAEVKIGGQSVWPKVSVTTKVRVGETPERAMERIVDFVTDEVNSQVRFLRGDSE